MAKRFIKPTVNWAELEKRVPPEQRNSFFAFKGKAEAYLRRVDSNPPEPPAIDWQQYSKLVPVRGLVDKLKEQYEKFQVPYPEDKLSGEVDKQWKAIEPKIKSYCAERQKDIDNATKELARIKALPKYDDLTLEMYAIMFPDDALDCVNKPSFWPHNPEEQLGYKPPELKVSKKK